MQILVKSYPQPSYGREGNVTAVTSQFTAVMVQFTESFTLTRDDDTAVTFNTYGRDEMIYGRNFGIYGRERPSAQFARFDL